MITISDTPGVGRKASSSDSQIVGVALENWAGGVEGKVLVFVHTAYTRPHTWLNELLVC